jgi:hypothetical protein
MRRVIAGFILLVIVSVIPVFAAADSDKTIFAVGYATLKDADTVARIYSDIGLRWIKIPDLKWEYFEPDPPVAGKHIYKWERFDKFIAPYQKHGFNIQVILRANSSWASTPLRIQNAKNTVASQIASTPPKDGYWDDFGAFVSAFVERYDGDGFNDMPGLKRPITYIALDSEAQVHFHWQGSVEEYIRLLKVTYLAAKKANPDTKVMLSAINMGDLFDDLPSEELVGKRIENASPVHKRWFNFVRKTLSVSDYYDVVDFHYNRDYQGAFGVVDFIRKYSNKPIWAGDASSAPFLFGTAIKSYDNPREIFEKVKAAEEPESSWFRGEQAKLTVKKFVVAAGLGVEKVVIETTIPWSQSNSPREVDYTWDLQSLVDKEYNPYPVFYTLRLLIDKIDGFTSVQGLDLGRNIYAYRFMVRNKPVYIFWAQDQQEIKVDLAKVIPAGDRLLTHIVTNSGDPVVRTENIAGKDILLTDEPVFIE